VPERSGLNGEKAAAAKDRLLHDSRLSKKKTASREAAL
jgi:hypothetical protein